MLQSLPKTFKFDTFGSLPLQTSYGVTLSSIETLGLRFNTYALVYTASPHSLFETPLAPSIDRTFSPIMRSLTPFCSGVYGSHLQPNTARLAEILHRLAHVLASVIAPDPRDPHSEVSC